MGCASGVVLQSGMRRGAGGGGGGAKGRTVVSLSLLRCPVLDTRLEQLPLLRQQLGASAPRLQL